MKKLFINPFEHYSEIKLLIAGIGSNVLLIWLSFQFNIQFIGNLKVNPRENTELKNILLEHLILLSITIVLLFILGKYLNSKTRFIDILTASLLSRIAFCLIPFVNINQKMYSITNNIMSSLATSNPNNALKNDLPLLLFFSIIILLSMVWFFILLYNGFKTATNAKNLKSIVLFITTIVIIEILSRILITNLT